MRVGEVRWWRSRRFTFVTVLLGGASLLALPTAPAANAAPARDAAAKLVKCRAGTSAWKFNKRKVCLPGKLLALRLPPVAAAVGGVLGDVLFDDKLERITRRYSTSRAVRRSAPMGRSLRAALGRGGSAAVAKGVATIVRRLTTQPLAVSARHGVGGALRATAAAGGDITLGDPHVVDANGNFRVSSTLELPDGSSVTVGGSGKINLADKDPTPTDGMLELGFKTAKKELADGTTAQLRFSLAMPERGELPDCPAADGTLSGKQTFKTSTTVIITRGNRLVSTHTKTIGMTAAVHAFVGDDGLLDHADVASTIHYLDAQHLEQGLIGGPVVLEFDASTSGRIDGAALRAGSATPYAVSTAGADAKRTVGISYPGLIDPALNGKLVHVTSDELTRDHGDLIKMMMTLSASDLRRAEKHWYTDEGCVRLSASAASDADPNHVVPVTLNEAKAADGKTFKANVAASGTTSITPGSATYTPGTPAGFNLTVPAERGSNGTWKLVATGKGGKKTASGTVSVRKLPPPPPVVFPTRFEGTWTRTLTMPSVGPFAGAYGGFSETINGTAAYVRDPTLPSEAEGLIPIPYWLESGSVAWTATGSRPAGIGAFPNCTFVYTGGATDPVAADFNSRLRLENVVSDAAPDHFYYAIRATPDPAHVSRVNQTATGTCPDGASTSFDNLSWGDRYLEIGVEDRSMPDAPLDRIEKSAAITLLHGHRTTISPDGITYDDSWTFHGTN